MPCTASKFRAVVAVIALIGGAVSADDDTEIQTLQPIDATTDVSFDITGDAKKGKKVFRKCKACHKVKEGKNGAGPSLFNIIGRASATLEGFKYSNAMENAELIWDVETLSAYLEKPSKVVPGTTMSFGGLKKDADIENVIAYLSDVSLSE